MKKLVLITIGCILITAQSFSQITKVTLNGFAYNDAISMVKKFNQNNVRKPMMTNIWFSKDMLRNMISLLKKEKGPNGEPVDGIRLYYAANSNTQNTVLVVSTYLVKDATSKTTFHQDYFEHDSKDPLFTMSPGSYNINGEICNDNSCGGGARLYGICKVCNDDSNCDPTKPHYISMQYAQEMVWNFGSGLINPQSEWFDLDMLTEIAKSNRFNGIRVYFARRSSIDPVYPGWDGFVIVTTEERTIDGIKIAHRDYLDCNETKSYFQKLTFHSTIAPSINDSGQDRGEQCQPPCQGSSLSNLGNN